MPSNGEATESENKGAGSPSTCQFLPGEGGEQGRSGPVRVTAEPAARVLTAASSL